NVNNVEQGGGLMYGYTKLFQSIITSTIWQEDNNCRVLWVTILALKDHDHICRATIPGLAKICNLSIEETERYMDKFQQPDKYSRSQKDDGRRIRRVDDGWFVINGEDYDNKLKHLERQDYIRDKVREHRAKKADV